MALGAGVKLGHYEISAPLGAGGMGEVYRAHDDRLGRDVAIKVLPANFARDEERLRRFTQEARAVAALNHPNILAIYDVGQQEGVPYLICELLKGETLRERLEAGPIPPRRALDYARQIAAGLAAAHDAGIVHRDLKPENIYLTSDNHVKLLDFGLAKLGTRSDDEVTRTHHTQPGAVLGTAGYMSPEQVRGLPADHRSDIFSLGVVLYEMLSGSRAFAGESSVEVMNAILKTEPPELKSANPGVNAVVEHCLQKNPAERFQSARDLAFALAALSSSSSHSQIAPPTQSWHRRPVWMYAALALLLVAAAATWWALRARAPAPAGAVKTVTFDRLTDFVGIETAPALSPDGRSVAFVADAGGQRQIWVQLTAGGTPLQITHDAGEHLDPRWSQDSASLLYYMPPREGGAGAVWEISALGGSPRKLVSSLTEADVSHDGAKLAFFRLGDKQCELVVSDRDGSNETVVAHFPNFNYAHPRWSPDDRSIAYDHAVSNWADDIYVIPAAGGSDPKQITHEGALMGGLAWQPDGKAVVYSSARGSTALYLPIMHLWSQDVAGGDPRQLTVGDDSIDHPDVARSGRIVASRWRMQFDIWKFPVDGKDALENARRGVRITQQTGQVQTPTLSPDESEVAFLSDSGSHGNIWVKNLRTGELRQITHERDPNVTMGVPVWSPDGSTIVLAVSRYLNPGTDVGYYALAPDGSGYHNVMKSGSWATWSPDGKWLYYSLDSPLMPKSQFDIVKIPAAGGEPKPVRKDGGMSPMVSPDGKTLYWVAPLPLLNGHNDYEVRKAQPEDAPSTTLFRIASERLPAWQGLHPIVSHSGRWLALTLNDEYGTNLWLLNTGTGEVRRAVDFSPRRTFIARRVAWSNDDNWIYAAVGEGDADVVSLNGLLQ